MTKKQREALTALRDVMREYDISFTSSEALLTRSIGVFRCLVFTSHSVNPIGHHELTKILEQETE